MKKQKALILLSIFILGISICISSTYFRNDEVQLNLSQVPESSASNYEYIENIMNHKLSELISQKYSDQYYESSIQATYYALKSLQYLGKLTTVNLTEITSFILSFYDPNTELFMDEYTKRYLDTDYDQYEFPLNSLLLTNCYAILALNITSSLGSIDIDAMKNFIWSCYNPETSGFIGVAYNIELPSEWRISTMDNTYYAVSTYDLLAGGDWSSRTTQKSDLIDYVESLQDNVHGGGFHNDIDPSWYSLDMYEPNIYSSYYCIKTLDIFDWIPAIDLPAFHNYLEEIYYPSDYYFEAMINPFFINRTNVVSTALGLASCDLTGNDTFIDRAQVLNFILSYRNPEGGFYRSSTSNSYELLDLYQILSGLNDADALTSLNVNDREELASFITLYRQPSRGFAPISTNFMSTSLLHDIIESFALFDRITELPIQDLYGLITMNAAEFQDVYGFCSCMPATSFRICPIDYLSVGKRQIQTQLAMPRSHVDTYLALVALSQIRKLNDFTTCYPLEPFIENVILSQFLDSMYPQNFGGFTHFYNTFPPFNQDKVVSILYAYYGIKVLEFVASELALGDIIALGFDVDALDTYILRHLTITSTEQYCSDGYETAPEEILEHTYYAAYILNAIGRDTLNASKIQAFILSTLNYSNIKSIYYSFKLSGLLNLEVEVDVARVHELIQAIYSPDHYEFYLTSAREEISQEAFLFVAEMAKTDGIRVIASYPEIIPLGSSVTINVTLSNLVLSDFGPYTTVMLETSTGSYKMDRQPDHGFEATIPVQAIAANYPHFSGSINVYGGSSVVTSRPFSIATTYSTTSNFTTSETPTKLSISLNASVTFASDTRAIMGGGACIKVFKNQLQVDTKMFAQQDYLDFSLFALEYYPSASGTYRIEIHLRDGIDPAARVIGQINYTCTDPDTTGGYRGESQEFYSLVVWLVASSLGLLIYTLRNKIARTAVPLKTGLKDMTKKFLSKFTSK